MRKAVLRLMMRSLVAHLRKKMPPSGQPTLHNLEAQALVVINEMEDDSPVVGEVGALTEEGLRASLEWIFGAMCSAHTGNHWAQLACHTTRLLAMEGLSDILTLAMSPTAHTHPKEPDTTLLQKDEAT